MHLKYRERTTSEDGTFVTRYDGDVLLVVARIRRTDVMPVADLVLPCFPIVARSTWAPLYEGRRCYAMARKSENVWAIMGVPVELSPEREVYLVDVFETAANDWARRAAAAAAQAEMQAMPTPRVTPRCA